jgi:predicted type IV restriction endonuclease
MSREEAKAIIEKLVNRFAEQRKGYHAADYNETKTRRDFIDPFFTAIGWGMDNSQDVAEPYREVIHEDKIKIQGKTKAPDYGFRLQGAKDRLFFVEAKKPSVSLKTNKESAFQIRRYGWNSGVSVSTII